MERNWAAQHLQVIRTLMERSAIYRRALTPVMILLGSIGVAASVLGWIIKMETNRSFGIYWVCISLAAVSGAFLMVRRQALRDHEVFWSPPTRRVTQAFLPPLFVGAMASAVVVAIAPEGHREAWLLLPLWMSLYGCAAHAAGFFMPRGIKLFGWTFIAIASISGVVLAASDERPGLSVAHLIMGAVFGGLHLAYGLYLYFSETRKNEP